MKIRVIYRFTDHAANIDMMQLDLNMEDQFKSSKIQIFLNKILAANIPDSKLFIAPNQTHYFSRENPVLSNKMVIDFFTKPLAAH